jgi:putative PIG3 family NAD(P)H quinone oxidoreductase
MNTNPSQAIFITRAGGPEVLELREVPIPEPRAQEVLIEVAFAGINRHDCNQRRRGPTPAHSDIPGLEVSGKVVQLGEGVAASWLGARVCALVDGGGYSRFAVAAVDQCFQLADTVTLQDGAALPEAMFTVWHNFYGVAAMQPGETVLIHGGTSGVGSLAIQILRERGHDVYVTCGTDDKCALARSLGALDAINYRTSSFTEVIAQRTHGRAVDVILDMAGARYGRENVEALARRGRLVHLSPGDGADFSAPLRAIMAKEAKVTGSLLRPLPAQEKAAIAEKLRQVVLPMVEAGRVRPLINRVLPLEDAALAHAALEAGDVAGKILLDCARGG